MAEKTTIKIFIASAAEVNEEREKAILLLAELNKSHKCLHLEPVLWEIDLVKGSYPGYKTIQDAINPRLKESQIIVFIFYSRIGKNTHIEFELAKNENKKMLVLFKEGFSPKKENIKTFEELLEFKESIDDILKIGYDNLDSFYKSLYANLNLFLVENHPCNDKVTEDESILVLSKNNQVLIQLLVEKDQKIHELQQQLSLRQNIVASDELKKLLQEKEAITNELQQSEEIIKQQVKDKEALEKQLILQKEKDNLKAKALEEVKKGNYIEAEEYLKQSAKSSIVETATTFFELAKIKKLQFQYADALSYYELAAKIEPENSLYLNEAGLLFVFFGLYSQAIGFFERALVIDKKKHGEEHHDISIRYNNLGSAYYQKGEYDKSNGLYFESLTIDKKIYGEEHPEIAIRYNNIGTNFNKKGEYDNAIEYYNKALNIDKKIYGEEHPEIAIRYNNIGLAYEDKGEYNKAIEFFEKALSINKKYFGEIHIETATQYNNLGTVSYLKKENDKAIELYNKALEICKKIFGKDHPKIASCYNNLGAAYLEKREFDKAIELFNKSLLIDEMFYGEEHPEVANTYNNLGSVYDRKGEVNKAIDLYDKALVIDKKFHGEVHPIIASDYNNSGLAYFKKGDYDRSIELHEKALMIAKKFLPANHPLILTYKTNLDIALTLLEKEKKKKPGK